VAKFKNGIIFANLSYALQNRGLPVGFSSIGTDTPLFFYPHYYLQYGADITEQRKLHILEESRIIPFL
jgi:hypothetical protein